MNVRRRRDFLADVGRGMLVASIGSAATLELGLVKSFAANIDDANPDRLTFGALEPLVALMQETPPEKLMPLLVQRLNSGVDLKTLVSAAALANARAFGGQDYTGFHTFMALAPALHIAGELPTERRALPVLKVIYRNSARIHEQGKNDHDTLQPIEAHAAADPLLSGEQLRDAVRAVDWQRAESQFAARVAASPEDAFNDLQFAVEDENDVHRVVFSWRAWVMLDLAGEEYAQTLLRQSVRYCLDVEQRMHEKNYPESKVRELLPRLLDEYKLLGVKLGTREADDQWTEQLAQTVFTGSHEEAADRRRRRARRRVRPRSDRRVALPRRQPAGSPRPRPQRREQRPQQTARLRPRRLGRRPRLRRRQRLAQHRPRRQPPHEDRQPPRRRLPHRRPTGYVTDQRLPLRRTARSDSPQ